jgi:adenosine deaminase
VSDLRLLPKANLHLHLTGAMRPSTLAELADRHGLTVPPPLPAGAHPWTEFQARYDAARAVIRSADELKRVVTEAIEDNTADGCTWLEIQLDPTSYAPVLGGFEPVVEAAMDALAGAAGGLIIASSWARSGQHAAMLAALAVRYGAVGFGLSNDERRGKVEDFVEATRIARDLILVPHGGFYEGAWHVRKCVELLGANRIGHALTGMRDQETLALMAEHSVTIEVCPTSYPPLGAAEYGELPLREVMQAGVGIALASDDPLVFGGHVTDQYVIARDHVGLATAELAAVARFSIEASAAPDDLKARTLQGITEWETAAARSR